MIGCLNVSVRDAAEKAMLHQAALDFVPDPDEACIEFLSMLLLFHGAPQHLALLTPINLTPSNSCLLFFLGRALPNGICFNVKRAHPVRRRSDLFRSLLLEQAVQV